jgi:putative nucleotide binding protein
MSEDTGDAETEYGVVLDLLPHGRSDADEPQYRRSPVAYAVGENTFALYELTVEDDADISIDDRIKIRPDFEPGINRGRQVDYDGLSDGARSELDYVIEEIVEADERRFVDFFNDAQPVTLRLHQLNLLPGIGDKLRDNILDERKRGPFESFDELEDRVSGLHDPMGIIVERIFQELTEAEDLKYRIFVRS